jgi:succinate-semialdehyde dehydrogenase/glutarate-semialdehyde dehydrogenase
MTEKAKSLKVGHGAEDGTTLGPVTTERGIEKALSLVDDAQKNGAKILTGGKRIDLNGGYFFEATVIGDANDELLLAKEEQFAPIAALFPFLTEVIVL